MDNNYFNKYLDEEFLQEENDNNIVLDNKIDNNINKKVNKKNTNKVFIVALILIIIVGICIGIKFILNTDNKKENNNINIITSNISGKYKLNDSEISILYTEKDNKKYILYTINYLDDKVTGSATINKNLAINKIEDIYYEFSIDNNNLVYKTNSKYGKSGTYKRISDYEKNDYYSENIGDIALLNSIYNVVATKDDSTIKIYQLKQNEVVVELNSIVDNKQYSYKYVLPLLTDGTIYSNNVFQTGGSIRIVINNNNVMVNIISNDIGSYNMFNGVYTVDRKLTVDDFIKIK